MEDGDTTELPEPDNDIDNNLYSVYQQFLS